MSYKYSFADNAEYGAEDMNALVSRMVSSGVADVFANGVAYNATKVNGVVKALYSSGVVPADVNTLKVVKQSAGVVAISPGLAFFADGSTIEVTEAETLSYEQGVKNYVYLKQDLAAQNRNYPACTAAAPVGDFVLLAEISADGAVTDKRTYARGKVPGYQSNANASLEVKQHFVFNKGDNDTATFSVDLGTNNYSRVFVIANDGARGSIGVYNFTDGSYYSTYNVNYRYFWDASDSEIVLMPIITPDSTWFGHLLFNKNGQTVTGTLTCATSGGQMVFDFTMVFC